MNEQKDYMLVEIPVYIDWEKLGYNKEENKKEILKKFSEELIDGPIINNVDDIDDYGNKVKQSIVEGIITKVDIVNDNKISLFGLIWVDTELELITHISQNDGKKEFIASGVSVNYEHKLNENFQKMVSLRNRITKKLNKKIELINSKEIQS